mgnify:FL=1
MIENIDSDLSKKILTNILKNNKINYKKLNILNLKNKIEKLKNDYWKIEKEGQFKKSNYKYFIFWKIIKKKI